MAFNPGKPTHLNTMQDQLIMLITQDLLHWESDVPHKPMDLLSINELHLYRSIRENHPNSIILAQVQLIRLVNVDCDAIKQEWMAQGSHPNYMPRFKRLIDDVNLLSLDFVVCNSSGTPCVVIELDGDEHTLDTSLIENWVIESSKDPNWDGVSLGKMPEIIKCWYRDRIKEHAIKSARINFIRFRNSDLSNYEAMQKLHGEITKFVI